MDEKSPDLVYVSRGFQLCKVTFYDFRVKTFIVVTRVTSSTFITLQQSVFHLLYVKGFKIKSKFLNLT